VVIRMCEKCRKAVEKAGDRWEKKTSEADMEFQLECSAIYGKCKELKKAFGSD